MHQNPFARMSTQEIYDTFLGNVKSRVPVPRWPSPDVQAGFIARAGVSVVKHTQNYLELLSKDGAFFEGWKGLDYGCGWGRFASLMLQYGTAKQLDLADPMPKVAALVKELGLRNRFYLVPQTLTTKSKLGRNYDFIFSYSVFTHFNEEPFITNFNQLASRLGAGGTLYMTVRQEDFLEQFTARWFKSDTDAKLKEFRSELRKKNFLFVPILENPERREFWGSTFVTPEYMRRILPVGFELNFLGDPDPSQKLYACRRLA